jgi:predicted aspartyl protease
MGTFTVQIGVGDVRAERFETVEALVDTGATYTVLPASMLRDLQVSPHTRADFLLADGRRVQHDIGRTWVQLDGQREFTLVVFGDEDAQPLLGAVTLEEFRLAPDPVSRRLIPVPGLLMTSARSR